MIGGTGKRIICLCYSLEDNGKISACGIKNRSMKQSCSLDWSRASTLAMPRVQSDVVMITTCGDKGSLIAVKGGNFKTKQVAIKQKRPVKIRDLQMNMSNSGLCRDDIILTH